ncbi:hypothetical protein KKC60_05565 [Patescibacteria group bacterium]|nr:hypothetical protein [Patescibacteria group bacterium]
MNSKNYLKIVLLKKFMILIVMLLVGGLALGATYVMPEKYTATTSLTLHRVNREQTPDFQYDNYYAIQSSEFLSNTLVSMFAAPDTVLEIYKKAGLESEGDINTQIKSIKPSQVSAHLIKVKVSNADASKAEKVLGSLVTVSQDKIENLESNAAGHNSFEVTAGEAVVSSNQISPIVALVAGLVSGLFLGIAFAFLKEYFKEEKAEEK